MPPLLGGTIRGSQRVKRSNGLLSFRLLPRDGVAMIPVDETGSAYVPSNPRPLRQRRSGPLRPSGALCPWRTGSTSMFGQLRAHKRVPNTPRQYPPTGTSSTEPETTYHGRCGLVHAK